MPTTSPLAGLFIIALAVAASGASAQSGFDRLIGRDESGYPIVITDVDGRTLSVFARAAGIPMGLELAPPEPGRKRRPVTLTGMTVEKALEVIAGIDARYEMRELGGVFVLRTRDAWDSANHPLHAPVPPVRLKGIRGRNALSLIAAFLGAPQYRETQLGDTKRFSLDLDAGAVLDLLNGTVRAHGDMAWSFDATGRGAASLFPYMVTLYSGASGSGCGVPGVAPEHPIDVALYADPALFAAGGSSAALDRIVGNGPNDRALVVNGPYPSAIRDLAKATKVPMGIEFLGPGNPPLSGSIPATGRTLRDVLDEMMAVDPRYHWREMDGVVVVRSATAWSDPDSLFFRLVPPVQLTDVSPQAAIERVARELGHPQPLGGIPHGPRISVDQPQGSVLDLVNAILRAHGEMTWELAPETHPDSVRQGYRYTLTFGVMGGGGLGFAVR